MKTRFLTALLLLAATILGAAASRESFNYYLVIDTSGSMAGRPAGSGNANIMPRVKEAVTAFLAKLAAGSRVAILPFDVKVHGSIWVTLAGETERTRAVKLVESLDPRGPRTCIYTALAEAFRWDQALKAKDAGARHVSTFLVFTDGLNDCDDSITMRDVLAKFRMIRGPNDFLFYTTLGVELPAAERGLLAAEPGVRYVAEPKGALEPISLVEARPAALDFGDIGAGGKATRKLAFTYVEQLAGKTVELALEMEGLEDREAVQLRPERIALDGGEAEVTLELLNPQSFRQRKFAGVLKLSAAGRVHVSPESLPIEFSTMPPRSYEVASPVPLPAALGELPFSAAGKASAQVRFLIQPSASIESGGSTLEAVVSLAPGNPKALEAGRHVWLSAGGARGAAVALSAGAREVVLGVELARTDAAPGQYQGSVVLSSPDADVRGPGLVPVAGTGRAASIPFSFSLAGERVVLVASASGAGFPLELGSVVLDRIAPATPAVLEKPVTLAFSPDAVARKASLRADLELSPGNPGPLRPGEDLTLSAGGAKGASIAIAAGTDRLMLRALVPAGTKPGTYRGRVLLWPTDVALGGKGLENVTQSETARSFAFLLEAEPEKRLTLSSAGWQADLGDLRPSSAGLRVDCTFRLAWSSSAVKAGATARASVRVEPAGPAASLKAGTQAGEAVQLTPEHAELTLGLDLPASASSGRYRATLEVRGEGCEVGGEGLAACGDRAVTGSVAFRVPRPLWIDLTAAALVLLAFAAWAWQASIPRFSALARLTVEEGPGAPGAYYLRGHQGRFAGQVWVGGRGTADLGVEGLAGRAFALVPDRSGRCSVVALSAMTLVNPDTGQSEDLSIGRATPLPEGAQLKVADLKFAFNQLS
ncbi:MAG: VWA domain-containing protein [Candidatus Wallbacteria bacterium]|nr:VWA domain-containing protein [Candidatus Wallbacteria bacterium]